MQYRDFNTYEVFPYEDKVINKKSGKTLKQSVNDRGYKSYKLYKGGKLYQKGYTFELV